MKFKISGTYKSSLEASWKEGIPANAMIVVIDYYLVPFALFLNATPIEIGFLIAIPHLLGSFSQLLAVRVLKKVGSRLRFLILGALFQAALILPAGLLALFSFPGRIAALIAITTFFRITANLIGTSWGSLISEYLEPTERGRYLGWRSQIAGLAGVAALSLAGVWLHFSKHFSLAAGFVILFSAAGMCRIVSATLFSKMTDLPYEENPKSRFTFFMFLRRFRQSNFVKFVFYAASITFAAQLAGPYFSVYMLKGLKLSYVEYMGIHLSAVLANLIAFPLWGRHADHVGNARILKITSFLVPVFPLLWLISPNPFYLMAVEFSAGFVWGGFTLCAANFIYDAVTPEKRVRCLGYFNLINGIAIFSGASIGGFLAEHLPPFMGFRLLTLFALSGILRLFAHFVLSGKFKEVRSPVKQASSMDVFFSVIGLRPMVGRNEESNMLPLR